MRSPKDETPDGKRRRALTRRLRHRAMVAEAEAGQARAEAEAARAQACEAVDAMQAELERERAALEADRRAFLALPESPEWRRDLLVLARDRVRAELLALGRTHRSCGECGSFGRGFSERFLQAEIDAMTDAHGLDPAPALGPADWPSPMGYITHRGRRLDASWHTPDPAQTGRTQTGTPGETWRPPHWTPHHGTSLSEQLFGSQ
ncbi:hypothetical protein [uncultured Algimonas sp.]|uniref:hypothetical protein n=1 Tax=uncultured Algimonas sp. TaxID=1547920 RepID=UPI0026265F1B|nr:hypothetical protein [uncultured Algimonas sp.]